MAGAGVAQTRRRPNFLFLIADDHAAYAMAADGSRIAETPHLDRLASEGTRFARHYCNSPVCTPSRQSFLTGQMPHAAGVTRLPTPLAENKPTIARQLRAAGYHTAVFGKMHFQRAAYPGLHGFDYLVTEGELNREWNQRIKPRAVPAEIRTKPPWRPFKDPASIWLNAEKLPYPRYEDEMKGTFLARLSCEYLEEQKDKQFAMWVSFQEPHSPFDFPIEDRNRFRPERFRAPRVGPQDARQIPTIFRDLSDAEKRGIQSAYYTSTSFLDRNIGRVLDKLSSLNLERDTLVFYMADHGYSLGEHGRFEKHCGYEPALRVPLIVRWPGRVRTGVVNDLTEHVDVPATILDLLGADPLPVQHGRSLRAYLEGRKPAEPRDHVISEYLENEEGFVRTDRYKLIYCSGKRARGDGYVTENPTPGRYVRLYDLKNDPGEFTNVAAKSPAVVGQLEELLLRRFRETHPEVESEPAGLGREDAIDWYLRPRDV
jgi:choline-sulfatase